MFLWLMQKSNQNKNRTHIQELTPGLFRLNTSVVNYRDSHVRWAGYASDPPPGRRMAFRLCPAWLGCSQAQESLAIIQAVHARFGGFYFVSRSGHLAF
jgi:hypothetical protein